MFARLLHDYILVVSTMETLSSPSRVLLSIKIISDLLIRTLIGEECAAAASAAAEI